MKELVITVDVKDKKKIMMECSVAGLTRYVTEHDEYDEINGKVNLYARKELQIIWNDANTDEGKLKLKAYEEDEIRMKEVRKSKKQSTSFIYLIY